MKGFRKGDLVSLRAFVMATDGAHVEIAVGGGSVKIPAVDLTMERRSFHPGDEVIIDGLRAAIQTTPEDGVHLVRVHNARGAEAYRVATDSELVHADDDTQEAASAPTLSTTRPAPIAAEKPEPVAKENENHHEEPVEGARHDDIGAVGHLEEPAVFGLMRARMV